MIDASAALQTAIFTTLRADAALVALFAPDEVRVYDRIPADRDTGKVTARFPFIHIGAEDDQVLDDSDQCHVLGEHFASAHVWSRAVGRVEAKQIAAAVAAAVDAPLAIEGFAVISQRIEGIRAAPGGDGLTSHRVVSAAWVIEPA
ncbi:MAG: DUF3168 domain-containing protein [Caulobacter sp.]